jgi:hypothetical protein
MAASSREFDPDPQPEEPNIGQSIVKSAETIAFD